MAVEEPPSPAADSSAPRRRQPEVGAGGRRADKQGRRLEVYNEVLARLRAAAGAEISPAFQDALWAHFHRLPARYALDVNAERAEDVVTHQRLLEEARDPQRRPALSVRVVQVSRIIDDMDDSFDPEVETLASNNLPSQMVHPPPAFGSSSNLEALALEANESDVGSTNNDDDNSVHLVSSLLVCLVSSVLTSKKHTRFQQLMATHWMYSLSLVGVLWALNSCKKR